MCPDDLLFCVDLQYLQLSIDLVIIERVTTEEDQRNEILRSPLKDMTIENKSSMSIVTLDSPMKEELSIHTSVKSCTALLRSLFISYQRHVHGQDLFSVIKDAQMVAIYYVLKPITPAPLISSLASDHYLTKEKLNKKAFLGLATRHNAFESVRSIGI